MNSFVLSVIAGLILLFAYLYNTGMILKDYSKYEDTKIDFNQVNEKNTYEEANRFIVLGGGCFWGVEAYFKQVHGVTGTRVGYTGGESTYPKYVDVKKGKTNHCEVTKVEYDYNKTNLLVLLEHLFNIIDPTLLNQQGGDIGTQYRTAIYYNNDEEKNIILNYIGSVRSKYDKPIVTEVSQLNIFWDAEDYHQDYVKYIYLI